MRDPKGCRTKSKPARKRPEDLDPDAIDPAAPAYAGVDWDNLREVHFELDPALVESIHARRRLKSLTLRVGTEQIDEARRVAAEKGLRYQAVLRQWLAEGASRARERRRQTKPRSAVAKRVDSGAGTR